MKPVAVLRVALICWLGFLPHAALSADQAQNKAAPTAAVLDPGKRISQFAHTTWRIQDGVLPGLPEAITQTTDGYLWIGTFEGLVRFDGVRFVPWSVLHKEVLPDYRIFSVYGAHDGSLWIGTARGLVSWKNGRLSTYLEPAGRINSIVEDDSGNIWIARSHVEDELGPLCEVVHNKLKCYGKGDGISFPSANKMARDQAGNIWIGGFAGLSRWTPRSSNAYFQKQFQKSNGLMGAIAIAADQQVGVWASVEGIGSGLQLQRFVKNDWEAYRLPGFGNADPGVTALFIDRDHTVWVGTARHGIYRIAGNNVDHFSSGDGLSSDAIPGFYQDREGTLWVATSKGVDRFRDVRATTFSIREGLAADSVSTVLAGREGRVWIGNSGALNFLNKGKLGAIRTGAGLPGRDVTTMFEDHAGRLWIGVDYGFWVYEHGQFHSITKGNVVFTITEDIEHNIWARVGKQLLRIQDLQIREEISLPEISQIITMVADPNGGLWWALSNGDLVHYRRGKLEKFPPHEGANPREIRALLVGADGSVLGATDEGLVRWKDGTRNILTSRNGLPCNEIYTLVNDDSDSVWLYTKCGAVAIRNSEIEKWWNQPQSTVSTRTLDVFDGAQPGLTPLQPQATRSSDGRLWFANDSLLQMIDPKRLGENRIPPPVHIEQIIADRKSYGPGQIDFSSATRDLEIDYAALSLVVPQKVQYRYKLEGHDRDWQDPGIRRQAFYNDLPPGKYKFHVIASNNDGVWNNDGDSLEFNIIPAFYQTNWFVLLCSVLTICLIWAAYRWRVRLISRRLDMQFEERLAERTRIAQDLHDTLLQGVLSASIQLHVADDYVPPDSPAKPLVQRVLELMKHVIDDGRNTVRGLRSPKEGLQDLDQALSRVPQELAVQRPVDFRVIVEGGSRILHPVIRDEVYRIGREALANAFRHSGANNIEVELEYAVHQLRVLVRDNGCGIDEHVLRSGREGHFGLSGMHERAERIGGKLKVWSRAAAGTEVELCVPGHVAFRPHTAKEKRSWLGGLQKK